MTDLTDRLPGPADVEYFTQAQAGAWGETLRAFARFLAFPPGGRVLDVGTGPGLLVRLLSEEGARCAVGCDDSLAMLRRAAALAAKDFRDATPGSRDAEGSATPKRLDWVTADALRLPFAAGAFDAAVATNLLFLLPDPAAGFAALARLTRPAGLVACLNPTDAMSIPAAEAFMDRRGIGGFARFSFINYARLAGAHHRLSLPQWIALAQAAGLTDIRTESRAGEMVMFLSGRAPDTLARSETGQSKIQAGKLGVNHVRSFTER